MNAPPRLPAEWEPSPAVLMAFPPPDSDWAADYAAVAACYARLAAAVTARADLLLLVPDVATVRPHLTGCDPARLHLVPLPVNDTWTRDYGPLTVQEGGRFRLLDFAFNGWGLKFAADRDNLATRALHAAGHLGAAPLETLPLVLEGGSVESDGAGTLLTTAACLRSPNRNPAHDVLALEGALRTALGAQRVLWLTHGALVGDDTDAHVDTLARFCDAQTIAYARAEDPADVHYEPLRRMEAELRAFRTAAGAPYRLVPLPLPTPQHGPDGERLPATYANFLILNGAVLVPTYNAPQDALALAALCTAFPGYEVVGIDCRPLIGQHGSLHCVTMQLPGGIGRAGRERN